MRYLFFVLVQIAVGYALCRYAGRRVSGDRLLSRVLKWCAIALPILSIGIILTTSLQGDGTPELVTDLLIAEIYFVSLFIPFDSATKCRYGSVTALLCLSLILPVMIAGRRNVGEPITTHYRITVPGESPSDSIRIALVTDIHLGDLFGEDHLARMEQMIEQASPDYVFIGGDLIDRNLSEVDTLTAAYHLSRIRKRTPGLYFVLGNHEYYGDLDENIQWISSLGTLLRDSVVRLRPDLYLIGRDYYRARDQDIVPLSNLVDQVPHGATTILLQHRPREHWERDPEVSGIDLTLTGHTHAGQIFPMQIFQPLLFRHNYGCHSSGDGTLIISSGYGASTSRLRIGSRSEIVVIDLYLSR
ncbi:MAG: metallophosphoesterase [Porphyromonas sp.]|uniref:metallophosphoesterase n=1 Tax=Porphyromonas sp. TaxID=1924944 RepID=UPI002A908F2A|nr:metallophosphoesterase [Porphyromonas sp.]MDD7468399.1 metallophosphoesterase [Bacteroidales bacterium]MDY6101769.1 metallophosphoesterase [Porphyromonas sp.]